MSINTSHIIWIIVITRHIHRKYGITIRNLAYSNNDYDKDDDHDDHDDHDATGDNTYHLDVLEPLLYLSHVLPGDASVLYASLIVHR